MPHKHKRKRDDDKSNFDLAPTSRAKPLPAYKVPSIFTSDKDGRSNKRRKSNTSSGQPKSQDDTPKQFARMMAWQAAGKVPSGLDTGEKKPKKTTNPSRSKPMTLSEFEGNNTTQEPAPKSTTTTQATTTTTTPKILPGESLSSFNVRVDQSLPLSTLTRSKANTNMPSDIKAQARLTKHNKRLQRMISDWRTTDAKIKEKRDEELSGSDGEDGEANEESLLWDGVRAARTDRKGKKKNARKQKGEDDPWRDLEKKRRAETKQKNLQDVVKAPPELKLVRPKFKVRDEDFEGVDRKRGGRGDVVGVDVKDVPGRVGSLRRREEIRGVRREVIDGYRKMAGKKRTDQGFPKAIAA